MVERLRSPRPRVPPGAGPPAGTFSTGDLDPDGFMRPVGAVYDVYLDRTKNHWILARVWD